MSYEIRFDPDSRQHLRGMSAYDRAIVVSAIEVQLIHAPAEETRHRKPIGDSPLGTWELRVGDFRVFYDVLESEAVVLIHAIGVKSHNRLTVGGEEWTL